ncbi:MAG TPA: hypothetical protein VMH27_20175 [Puia sp.]|nr:hypothetical protein [Puia sp.]
MRFHVIQHVAFETAGLLGELIRERGHSLQVTALWDGSTLPEVTDFDVLIIMGGPMSVHDEAEFPWLAGEKALIGKAIGGGKKVLGICLGAQLIAEVCGSKVYPAGQKEIGWWPVKLPDGTSTIFFHWHGETFDLPPSAELLASTDVCVNQAFRIGDRVLGIQFHPEVTVEIIRGMIGHEGWELEETGPFIQRADKILEGIREFRESGFREPWLCNLADWLGL